MRKILVLVLMIGLAAAACAPVPQAAVQTLVAALPLEAPPGGPLGGRIPALPTPDPGAATPTPPPSQITFPTAAAPVAGPFATLTAIGGLVPTFDLNATPYAITLRGVPVFIEFQARW